MIIPLSALNTVRHTTPKTTDHEPCIFICKVPTQLETDRLANRLYELGVTPTSTSTIRATMINALYEDVFPDDEMAADEAAQNLHDFWEKQDAHENAMRAWTVQDAQRVIDQAEGAPKRDAEPMPDDGMTVRQRYRGQSLMDRVNETSLRYRQMIARRNDYDRANAWMMVRMQVVGCEDETVMLAQDSQQVLTEDSMEQIKLRVGVEGMRSLITFVQGQFGITEDDKLPLGSPAGNGSDQTGSTDEAPASETRNGASTPKTKPSRGSGRHREAESETITEQS